MEEEKKLEKNLILKEIAELLNEGIEINHVLSEVLNKLLHLTGLNIGWIYLINEDGSYVLAAHKSLPPALSYHQLAPMCDGQCWCLNRYNDGRLDKATNIIECKRIEDALKERREDTNGLTHHATVPLRAGKEKFGLLNIGSPQKTHFQDKELALLEAIAFQVGTAIKRMTLTQKEQELVLTAERNRLARDLHDSVNQLLFSLSLTARGGKEMTKDENIRETFSCIQDIAQEALSEMRSLIWQLRPRGLENGLVSAFQQYASLLGLTIHTTVKGVVCLPNSIEEALWRIGQEALSNCKKHSGKNEAWLEIIVKEANISIIFTDHGHGFHYDKEKEIPSLGLKSMKGRTESLNGEFTVRSVPKKGTTIKIMIPIKE